MLSRHGVSALAAVKRSGRGCDPRPAKERSRILFNSLTAVIRVPMKEQGLVRMGYPYVSRLMMALTFRALPRLPRLYVPAIGQVVDGPALAYSPFLDIFGKECYRPLVPLPPDARVLDLGANVGMMSLYFAQRMRGGRITAVEASPRTFPLLQRNLDRLRRRTGITIEALNVAVADTRGELVFWEDSTNQANVANTAFREIGNFPDADHFIPVRVPAITLSDLLDEPVHFLKCDVEGAEYRILAPELIDPARIAQLVVEFHDVSENRDAFSSIIGTALDRGYAVYDEHRIPVATANDLLDRVPPNTSLVLHFCDAALLRPDTDLRPRAA